MAITASSNPGAGKTRREDGMENRNTLEKQTVRRILGVACASCLAAAFAVSLPQPARARHITPPAVPSDLQVDLAKNEAFLEGHAVGTQNYICLATASMGSKSPPTSSVSIPTHLTAARFAPHGSTRRTRASSGGATRPAPSTPTSSRRMPFPGSCCRWPESKTDRSRATTHCR